MPSAPVTAKLAIPLPSEGANSLGYWSTQIEQAKEAIKKTRETFGWNVNTERYVGKFHRTAPTKHRVDLPKDFSYTEQKMALLFFQTPEVVLTAARPDVTADTALLAQSVLNELVGPDQLNAKQTIDEILKDVLVPAGIGIGVIGYDAFVDPQQPTVQMEVGQEPALDASGTPVLEPVIDPMSGLPAFDPTTGMPQMRQTMQPIYEDVPNILREQYSFARVSPVDFLYPASFRGSDWQKAPWIGYKFRLSPHVASQLYGLTPEQARDLGQGAIQPDMDQSLAPDRSIQKLEGVDGVVIWYRAIEVDATVGDPERIRRLVLLNGQTPITHDDSPFQTINEGRVIEGLKGYPIFPLVLRTVPDSPLPPSDCAMSRVLVDELSEGRTQMLQQRDRNVSLRGVNIDKIAPVEAQKLLNPGIQELIQFSGLDPGEMPIFGLAQSSFPDENFTFNNIGDRDVQECWAISANQLGVSQTAGRTATEISGMAAATESRMEAERIRVLRWWTSVAQGLFTLVQRYAPDPQIARIQTPDGQVVEQQMGEPLFVQVLGPEGAQRLTAWTKQDIQGQFAFHVRPDSSRRIDQAAERKFRVDVFNLLGNDPTLNRQELIRWMAPTLGLDPEKLFLPPQPPKEPEPRISLSLSVSAQDLANPLIAPTVIPILQAQGLLPKDVPMPAPGGGPASGEAVPGSPSPAQPPLAQAQGRIPPVNQHQADLTGALPGAGAATSRPS